MNVELLSLKIEHLESVFLNILCQKPDDRIINPNMTELEDLKSAINELFNDNTCTNVLYTRNTDKQFFGIRISPNMSPADATIILASDERVKLDKYQIEFDSKLFDIGLNARELAALTIYEISSMMDNPDLFDRLRALVDIRLIEDDTVIDIRESVNHAQLIIFAIKDTMYKLSSIVFVEDEDIYLSNPTIEAAELGKDLVEAKIKIANSISGLGDSFRTPSTSILDWMLMMYKNMKINSRIIYDVLTDAKAFTASKLELAELDKTLQAVDRIDNSIIKEFVTLDKFMEAKNISTVNEISLFKNLKRNGLRGIENDLYEFAMRVKNCTDADDAFLILRGINSRLGLLEDYLANETKLSENDRAHWVLVADKYRQLRDILVKKKFDNKTWGIFTNWDRFDAMSNDNNTQQ